MAVSWLTAIPQMRPVEYAWLPVRVERDVTQHHTTPIPGLLHLAYYTEHPYSVVINFGGGVLWDISRELLDEGRRHPCGDWHVNVRPLPPYVVITLQPPSGTYVFQMASAYLGAFLEATAKHVPFGAEPDFLNIDLELAMLSIEEGGTRE